MMEVSFRKQFLNITLSILMDYPIRIDTKGMELFILYFKGLHVIFIIKYISAPED